jgi:HK97 family phage portal protein
VSGAKRRRTTPTLRAGERVNPDNLRYIDGQGMPQEEVMGGVWASEVKAFMHAHTLKSLFFSEDWVFITTDSIALPISRCPLAVFTKERAEDGKDRRMKLDQHPITKLMESPNPYQSAQEVRYALAVDTVLGGNGFLYHVKALSHVYHMPFERVQYHFDKDGLPSHVIFHKQFQDDAFAVGVGGLTLKLSDVTHARRPNPSSAFWGLSPFIPGRRSILFNRYSQDYLLAFYLKGATPQMILEVENATSQKSLVRMIRAFEAAYTGRRNQRRTLVLPKGVKATPADSKIADQQLVEMVKGNRETVLNILRVPKHALGLQEAGSLGSREHELALRWYWKQTILPTMELIESSLTRHFRQAGMLADGQVIAFDTSDIDYVAEDLFGDAETSEKLAGSWTVNERRVRIFGLPPIPEGDVIATLQKTPAPFSAPTQTPPPAQPEEVVKPESKPTPVSEPPAPDVTTNAEPKPDDETTLAAVPTPVGTIESPEQEPWHANVLRKYETHLAAGDETMRSEEQKQFPRMFDSTAELLVGQTEAAVVALKASARTRGTRDEFDVDPEEFEKRLSAGIEALAVGYLADYNKTLIATVDAGYGAQLGMVFEPKARDALEAYREKDVEGQRTILKERGLFAFKSAKDTTTSRVTSLIEKAIAAGKTLDETAKSIVSFMKGEARWRADMIARTETLTAFSIGSMATIERAKEAVPGMKKMWVTAADERVRETHQALMGKVVEDDAKFANGLRYPRDPAARDASETINCRCRALMLMPEDVADYVDEMESLSPKPVDVG